METPFISAIIPTFERYDIVGDTIESVLRQDYPADRFELIVVDNATPSAAADALRERYAGRAGVSVIHQPRRGVCAARNMGMERARGDIVAFLDDDCRAEQGWLAGLARGFSQFGPDAAVVGGRVDPIWLSPPPDWLDKRMLDALSLVDLGPEMRPLAESGEWITGCNMAFDREKALAAGGFPEHLGRFGPDLVLLSNDETFLIERLRAEGYLAIYAPDAVVGHRIPMSRLSRQWFRRRAAWQAVSDYVKNPVFFDQQAALVSTFPRWQPGSQKPRPLLGRLLGRGDDAEDIKAKRMSAEAVYERVLMALAGIDPGAPEDED